MESLSKVSSGKISVLEGAGDQLLQDLDHYLTLEQLSINPIVETQDTALQKILGVNGKGLLALPNFAVEELVDEGKLFTGI